MRNALDVIQQSEQARRAAAFVSWATCLNTHITDNPVKAFRDRGWGYYTDMLATKTVATTQADGSLVHTKAIALSTDVGVVGQPLSIPFVGEVEQQTITGKIDAVRVPLSSAARIQAGVIESQVVAEGQTKPVAQISFTVNSQPPTKIIAQIVCSVEWLRAIDEPTQAAVARQLVSATAIETDTRFIAEILSGVSPTSGTMADLLAAVSGGAAQRLYLIGSYATLVPIAPGLRDLRDMGITILITPAATNRLIAIDGSGLLIADDGDAHVETATHASLYLSDGGSPPSETLTSLWERNLAAVRAERYVRYATRAGAAAYMTVEEG